MKFVILMVVVAWASSAASWDDGFISAQEENLWWAQKYQGRLKEMERASQRQDGDLRLPRDVIPISYDITLIPILEVGNFTTHGTVEIRVKCETNNTQQIVLHSANLTIESVGVKDIKENFNLRTGLIIDDQNTDREMITIPMLGGNYLDAGKEYLISIKFISYLNDDLKGFYRSSYVENGETKYLAVTQFEAPDARRSFPCFDEPNMKATFKITIGQSGKSVISNMPKEFGFPSLNPDYPGYRMEKFETSVKMSTYLVAFMVSEFVGVAADTSLSRTQFKVWARPSFRNQTKYAVNIGPSVLKFFEYYFLIDYPLPKQDMAAIPDFSAGAMENWGLITYRESDLLYDPLRSSEAAKRRVAEVVAHELAHQWFGNLVTMDWWNVIWLNEGFARYMQYIGTNAVEPSFNMNDQFGIVTLQAVFQTDSLESSRPINMQVTTTDEINAMFDTISYNKGASILRMLANFVGLDTFQRGITRYLKNKAYKNAVEDDLWQALQEQVVEDDKIELPSTIKAIMDSWTVRMGFPLINVTRNYDPTSPFAGATVAQKRFLLRESGNSTDSTVYRWWVPLTFTGDFSRATTSYWLSNSQQSIVNLGVPRTQWVIFNVDQVGYYRVLYDDTNYNLIQAQLMTNHKEIPVVNRAQLLDDTLNIARADLIPYERALEMTKYLERERDYVPWSAASSALDYIDLMFAGQADEAQLRTYLTKLMNQLYQSVGATESNGDGHLTIYARSIAVSWACTRLNMNDCITNLKAKYNTWLSNPNSPNNAGISPNLLRLTTCTGIAEGGRAEWNFGFDRYNVSTLINEKNDLLRALTCSKDKEIINDMLNLTITPGSSIRLQDVNTFFTNIAANPVAHELALDFMINRWNDIVAFFNGYAAFGGGTMPNLFRALCNRINTRALLDKLLGLRNAHMDLLGKSKTVEQGIEVAEANVVWVNKNYVPMVNWLKIVNEPVTTTTTTTRLPSTSSAPNPIKSEFFILILAVLVATRMMP